MGLRDTKCVAFATSNLRISQKCQVGILGPPQMVWTHPGSGALGTKHPVVEAGTNSRIGRPALADKPPATPANAPPADNSVGGLHLMSAISSRVTEASIFSTPCATRGRVVSGDALRAISEAARQSASVRRQAPFRV
jgi:hypothetical protein